VRLAVALTHGAHLEREGERGRERETVREIEREIERRGWVWLVD
jgi:hypothetical protein